jgi:hypothetical protein
MSLESDWLPNWLQRLGVLQNPSRHEEMSVLCSQAMFDDHRLRRHFEEVAIHSTIDSTMPLMQRSNESGPFAHFSRHGVSQIAQGLVPQTVGFLREWPLQPSAAGQPDHQQVSGR